MSPERTALERVLGALPTDTAVIRAAEDRYQVATYAKLPLALVRGEGSYVWSATPAWARATWRPNLAGKQRLPACK